MLRMLNYSVTGPDGQFQQGDEDFLKMKYQNYDVHGEEIGVSYRLVSSKSNQYSAGFSIKNEQLRFSVVGKIQSTTKISKEDFFKAETINIGRNYTKPMETYNFPNWKLEYVKDSIFEDRTYKLFRHYNSKSKIKGQYFMVEPIADFEIRPYIFGFNDYLTKLNLEVPNGVIKLKYFLNKEGENSDLGGWKLLSYHKITKFIKIDY